MEMVKYHTAETADLREEFRKEIVRKLAEQKKNIKIKKHHHNILIPTVKQGMCMAVPQDEYARFVKEMVESHNVVTTVSLTTPAG